MLCADSALMLLCLVKHDVQTSGEVADTTEASNGSGPAPVTAAAAAGTESEREAASVAQVEVPSAAEMVVRVRRDTEPVTTSLSTEEHSHTSDNAHVCTGCSCRHKTPHVLVLMSGE